MSDRDLERGPQGDHGQDGVPGIPGPPGLPGAQGKRGRDAKAWRLWPTLRLLAFILVAAASIFAAARTYEVADDNRQTIQRVENNQRNIEREGVERRDQICEGAEAAHAREVESLRSTYLYLTNLREDELNSTFNRFIIAQVPQTEDRARSDEAPDFCDEPGAAAEARGEPVVGLPEPDPVIPKRPAIVDALVKKVIKPENPAKVQDLRNADRRD